MTNQPTTDMPQLGTVAWAARWRVLHPSGINEPLTDNDVRWHRALAEAS